MFVFQILAGPQWAGGCWFVTSAAVFIEAWAGTVPKSATWGTHRGLPRSSRYTPCTIKHDIGLCLLNCTLNSAVLLTANWVSLPPPRWFRLCTAMERIQYGSTPFWTQHRWWAENERPTLRTNCSEWPLFKSEGGIIPVDVTEWFPSFFYVSCCLNSPNKSEFIKAKYQMLAFVHRMPCREDDSSTANDLSKVLQHVSLHETSVKAACVYVNRSSFVSLSNFTRVFALGIWRLVWGCYLWEPKLISFTL